MHIFELWLLEEDENGRPRWLSRFVRNLARKYDRKLRSQLKSDGSIREPELRDDPEGFLFRIADSLPDNLVAQPDRARSALVWLVDRYLKGGIRLAEDMMGPNSRAMTALAMWADRETRRNLGLSHNIDDYPDLVSLEKVTTRIGQEDAEVPAPQMLRKAMSDPDVAEGTEVVLNTVDALVVRITNYPAARFWGSGTHWCTVPNRDECESYLNMGPLYVILDKNTGSRYQLHAETAQLMDTEDVPVDPERLIQRLPELEDALRKEFDTLAVVAIEGHPSGEVPVSLAWRALRVDSRNAAAWGVLDDKLDRKRTSDELASFLAGRPLEEIRSILDEAVRFGGLDVHNAIARIAAEIGPKLDAARRDLFVAATTRGRPNCDALVGFTDFRMIIGASVDIVTDAMVLDFASELFDCADAGAYYTARIREFLEDLANPTDGRPHLVDAALRQIDPENAVELLWYHYFDTGWEDYEDPVVIALMKRVHDTPQFLARTADDLPDDLLEMLPPETWANAVRAILGYRHFDLNALVRYLLRDPSSPHALGILQNLSPEERIELAVRLGAVPFLPTLLSLLPKAEQDEAVRRIVAIYATRAPEQLPRLHRLIPSPVEKAVEDAYERGEPWAETAREFVQGAGAQAPSRRTMSPTDTAP